MADRREGSSRRPSDRGKAHMSDEQMREQMKLDKQKIADERKEHTRFMRKARDAQDAAREARNQPPPASGWGSMSNPETTSASDRTNEAAGPAAHNQDSRFEREPRSPPSRERREDAERGSREYDELCGLLSPQKRPAPPSMASPRWSLTEGLVRAWGASCGHLQREYCDRVLPFGKKPPCPVRYDLVSGSVT